MRLCGVDFFVSLYKHFSLDLFGLDVEIVSSIVKQFNSFPPNDE